MSTSFSGPVFGSFAGMLSEIWGVGSLPPPSSPTQPVQTSAAFDHEFPLTVCSSPLCVTCEGFGSNSLEASNFGLAAQTTGEAHSKLLNLMSCQMAGDEDLRQGTPASFLSAEMHARLYYPLKAIAAACR